MKKETLAKLAAFSKGPDYPAFITKLIVQGLIKIEEETVEIQSRAEDKATVAKVVGIYFITVTSSNNVFKTVTSSCR